MSPERLERMDVPDHPLRRASDHERRGMRRSLKFFLRITIGQFIATVTLIVLVFVFAAQARDALHESQLRACERGKLDRTANALGWRTAEAARRASGTKSDLRAADAYAQIAEGLERRSRIDCEKAFPKS